MRFQAKSYCFTMEKVADINSHLQKCVELCSIAFQFKAVSRALTVAEQENSLILRTPPSNRAPTSTLFSLRSRINSFCCFNCCCSSCSEPIRSVAAASCGKNHVCILSLHEHETPEEILKSGAHFSLGPFILPRSCQAILQLYSPYSLNKATTFISVPPAQCPHHLFLSHSTKSQTQPQVFMCSALPGTQNKAQGSHGAAGTLWQFQVEIPQKALDAELYQFRL